MKIESILQSAKSINKDLNSRCITSEQLKATCNTLQQLWSIKEEKVKDENDNEITRRYNLNVRNSETATFNPHLQKIQREIYNIFSSMDYVKPILQGSTADDTFHPGWSDIDLIILVDKPCNIMEIATIKEGIDHCKQYIQMVQPLQHHGIFVLPRAMLTFYPESFMPPQALYCSVSCEEFQLSFKTYLQPSVFKMILEERLAYIQDAVKSRYYKHHCYNSIPLALDNIKNCPYQLFAYINYLFLVPSIYKSATCDSQYKGHTLRNLAEMKLSEPIIKFLDKINRFRDQWIEIGYKEDILEATLDNVLVETLGCNFWNDAYLYEKYFYERARESIERVD